MAAVGQVMELRKEQPPEGLGGCGSQATDAWLVWYTLRMRARSPEHRGEFADRDHDGTAGLIWRGGSMRRALSLAFGEADEEPRLGVAEWLADTQNMMNIGGRTGAGQWWIRDEYQDRRPGPRRGGQAAAAAEGRKCRWCPEIITPPEAAPRHEKARHPAEFRQAAGYLCPLDAPGGGSCDAAAESPRAMGRHLAASAHGVSDEARRQLLIDAARRLALGHATRPRPAVAAVQDPGPGVPAEAPAGPPPAAGPPAETASGQPSAPGADVLAALESMLASMETVRAWVAGTAGRERQLQERLTAALAWRAAAEGPLAALLDLATA